MLCRNECTTHPSGTCDLSHLFKDLYYNAWLNGCKGITTFGAAGKRYGILNEANDNEPKAEACFIELDTGQKSCD